MVDSVTKRYKLPSGYEVEALGGISLELIKGEMLAGRSMGGSNEFVECFCWGAVAEGGSGAVVQFVGDGVEVGLVAGAGGFLRIHRREGKQMPCSMSVFLGWA